MSYSEENGQVALTIERQAFEQWIKRWKPSPPSLKRTSKSGRYDDVMVWMCWLAWIARAKLKVEPHEL